MESDLDRHSLQTTSFVAFKKGKHWTGKYYELAQSTYLHKNQKPWELSEREEPWPRFNAVNQNGQSKEMNGPVA